MPSYRQIVMEAVVEARGPCGIDYLWEIPSLRAALKEKRTLAQTVNNLVSAKRLERVTVDGVSKWQVPVHEEDLACRCEPSDVTPTTPAAPPPPKPKPPIEVRSILPAIDKLVGEIVETVVRGLEQALPAAIERAVAHRVQETLKTLPARILAETPTAPPPADKAKVLVVGLLPGLAHQIETEFTDVFDLRFMQAHEQVGSRLKSLAHGSKHTILMGDFISHKHTETVNSAGVRPIVLHGGMTKLRDKLTELYANE